MDDGWTQDWELLFGNEKRETSHYHNYFQI